MGYKPSSGKTHGWVILLFLSNTLDCILLFKPKNITVAETLSRNLENISFRRTLLNENFNAWSHLLLRCTDLSSEGDVLLWKFSQNKQFLVQPMYSYLINSGYCFAHRIIWKVKIPLKIKISLWYSLRSQKSDILGFV